MPDDTDGRAAFDELAPLVYDQLRRIAHSYMHGRGVTLTLRPTEIVNEACLHLMRSDGARWNGPEHFRAVATRKIWQVVIDYLKRRQALKRGGGGRRGTGDADSHIGDPATVADGNIDAASPAAHPAADSAVARSAEAADRAWQRLSLEAVQVEWHDRVVDLLDLADAIDALGEESVRLRDIVVLRWFGGMTHAETAEQLGLGMRTVEKDFRYALAWLNRRLASVRIDGD